jgi:hypothetical protein
VTVLSGLSAGVESVAADSEGQVAVAGLTLRGAERSARAGPRKANARAKARAFR